MMLFSYPELQLLDSVTAQRDSVLDIVYSEVFFYFLFSYCQPLHTVVTIGIDSSVNLWKITNSRIHYTKSFDSSIGRNKAVCLSSDGLTIACRFDSKQIQLWDLQNCEKMGIIDFSNNQMYFTLHLIHIEIIAVILYTCRLLRIQLFCIVSHLDFFNAGIFNKMPLLFLWVQVPLYDKMNLIHE